MHQMIPFQPRARDKAFNRAMRLVQGVQQSTKRGQWFDIQNQANRAVDIYLYEFIGDPFAGTDALSVVEQLRDLDVDTINLHINSPGGFVFDGLGIYNVLVQHKATVNVTIDGLAASIASVIALAGDTIAMAENALLMIHDPLVLAIGNAQQLRREADVLDKIRDSIATTYATRTEQERDQINEWMGADDGDGTWFSAAEAKEAGFIDEVIDGMKAAACESLEFFGYDNIPANIAVSTTGTEDPPPARADVEATTDEGEAEEQSTIPTAKPTNLDSFRRRQALLEKSAT